MSEIPCAASVAERDHDRPSAAAAYWPSALDQIVESVMTGQYPESGRPSIRLIDEIDGDFIFRSWLDIVIQHKPEAQANEVQRVRERIEEMLRYKLANDYRVGFLAEDMLRNAGADDDD